MKKIISICMVCLFFAMTTSAANLNSGFENSEIKKISYTHNVVSDKYQDFEINKDISAVNKLPWQWCYVSNSVLTGSGYDMYGNYWETWNITVTCYTIT